MNITGLPGTQFEGLEFVRTENNTCDKCVLFDGCSDEIKCVEEVGGRPGYWIKTPPEQPAAQDVTPTVPGWYWVRFGNDPVLDQTIELITSTEIERQTVYLSNYTAMRFSDCQFDGPINPPARWGDANAGLRGDGPGKDV